MAREIEQVRAEYHEKVSSGDITIREQEALSARIKQLMADMAAVVSKGAAPCSCLVQRGDKAEKCGLAPIGMKRRAGLWEIGCPDCRDIRAQADSNEEAVGNWNDGILSLPPFDRLHRCGGCKNVDLEFTGPPASELFQVRCRQCEGVVVKGNSADEALSNWNNSTFADPVDPSLDKANLPIGKAAAETVE